jgi:hypothetical protein
MGPFIAQYIFILCFRINFHSVIDNSQGIQNLKAFVYMDILLFQNALLLPNPGWKFILWKNQYPIESIEKKGTFIQWPRNGAEW